jgi:hypothetical protein
VVLHFLPKAAHSELRWHGARMADAAAKAARREALLHPAHREHPRRRAAAAVKRRLADEWAQQLEDNPRGLKSVANLKLLSHGGTGAPRRLHRPSGHLRAAETLQNRIRHGLAPCPLDPHVWRQCQKHAPAELLDWLVEWAGDTLCIPTKPAWMVRKEAGNRTERATEGANGTE